MRPVFIHIPKTGGTSVKSLLFSNYKSVFVSNQWEDRGKLLSRFHDFDRYDAFAGHIPFAFYENFPQDEMFFFSVIRHPVDRVRSEYAYIRRTPDHPAHERACLQSFHDFALTEKANEQCAYLGLVAISADEILEYAGMHSNFVLTSVSNLEFAMRVIGKKLNWKHRSIPKLNVSSIRELPAIDNDTQQLILQRNDQDWRLLCNISKRTLRKI